MIPRKRTLAAPSSKTFASNQDASNHLRRQRQINAAHASLPIHNVKEHTAPRPLRSVTRGCVLRPAPIKVKAISPKSAKKMNIHAARAAETCSGLAVRHVWRTSRRAGGNWGNVTMIALNSAAAVIAGRLQRVIFPSNRTNSAKCKNLLTNFACKSMVNVLWNCSVCLPGRG